MSIIPLSRRAAAQGRERMLRKISILFSVVAALSLAFAVATPSTSFAKNEKQNKQQNKPNKQNKQVKQNKPNKHNVKVEKKHVVVKKHVHVKYVHGHRYNGNI